MDNRAALASAEAEGELDRVYTLDHFVTVGPGRRVHAVEKFTPRSWLRSERRAILLLPGTIVKANFYDIDVDGYRFQSDLAKAGFFTFAIDSEGSGESTYPDDGHTVTHSFLVDEGRTVLNAIRFLRAVPRVDVLGEANGGAVAAELCADLAARTCVMSSMIFRTGTPFFTSVYLDPAFVAMIDNQPKGYMNVTDAMYFNISPRSPAPVAAEILAKQPGTYAVDPMLAPTHGLPWFDPSHARVPGLIIQGTVDDIATQSDAEDLRASYGSVGHGRAQLVRIAGANHTPRIENAPFNTQYETAVLDFLNAH
jgi:pimeloyl-ACP methyl ester carboxylesterase